MSPTPRTQVVVVGALMAALVAFAAFARDVPPDASVEGLLISARFDPPVSGVEAALDLGDGQVFATHAADPFLDQPEMIRGGPEVQAYRFQRPAFGWLGWAASLGQPGNVPWAMVGLTVASVVALLAVAARALERQGSDPRLALLLLVTPGVLADLQRVGPEALGTALVLGGAGLWLSRRPAGAWMAVACFAIAALCRETFLIVPAVLVLLDLRDPALRIRTVVRGAAIVAPYLAWMAVLRAHLGELPAGKHDLLTPVPYAGLVDSIPAWAPLDWAFVVAVLGSGVAAVARGRQLWMRLAAGAHLVLGAFLGAPVWIDWQDWGRVMLPLCAVSLLALAHAQVRTDGVGDDRLPAEGHGSVLVADALR